MEIRSELHDIIPLEYNHNIDARLVLECIVLNSSYIPVHGLQYLYLLQIATANISTII